jgi:hypothetical protein
MAACVLLAAGAASTNAQSGPDAAVEDDCWVSNEKLVNAYVQKASRDMGRHLGLDEYQQQLFSESFRDEAQRFIAGNRETLKPLINDYVDAVFGSTPPTPELAAEWADRALPVIGALRDVAANVGERTREFMTEEQEARLDSQLAAVEAGADVVTHRLLTWSDGGFDAKSEWPGSPQFRELDRKRRVELEGAMETARRAALNDPAAQPETPKAAKPKDAKDEWTLYTESFIRRYRLNEDQQQRARLALQGQISQRDRYLARCGPEMERISALYTAAKDDEALKKAEAAYARLMEPAQTMFEVLKKKLDRLPTRAQRAAAAKTDGERRE